MWNTSRIGDRTGTTAVVTGSTSGIGYEAARLLAEHGANVVLACRNPDKAREAQSRIRAGCSTAKVDLVSLDLGSLRSVASAAEELRDRYPAINLLINNAGVMIPPYGKTEDGFELQFGTNHLGHFALTGHLLHHLMATPGSRVVTVASAAHKFGRINFEDLQSEQRYRAFLAYGQSKLANLLFCYELQRRLSAVGSSTLSVAAHPGWSRTGLQRHATRSAFIRFLNVMLERIFSQSALGGALPTLRAATEAGLRGGEYYGPSGLFEMKGDPVLVSSNQRSKDQAVQRQLWDVSVKLTGVTYPI